MSMALARSRFPSPLAIPHSLKTTSVARLLGRPNPAIAALKALTFLALGKGEVTGLLPLRCTHILAVRSLPQNLLL